MYRRDHDDFASSAADPSSSFPSDCWPPPRRSTHFRPSTTAGSKFSTDPLSSAAGASDPFRHQGKSSDHVIQQLRDELDKHRQMFFDRVGPQWSESTPQRSGFPFSESARRAFGGGGVPHHHHSSFHHDEIPSWMTDDEPTMGRSSPLFSRMAASNNVHPQQQQQQAPRQRWPSGGSGRSGGSNSSSGSAGGGGGGLEKTIPIERSDSPNRPIRVHKPAARSATGDFPPGGSNSPSSTNNAAGFCRASSAPPVDTAANATAAAGSPRRFTTTVHHQPANASSPGPNRRPMMNSQHQQQQQQHNTGPSSSAGPSVRHIPIMVEGRDEPVLPSVVEEDQQTAAERRSKTAIPMPFYPTTTPSAPSTSTCSTSISSEEAPAAERDGSIPIALPYDRLSDDSTGRSVGSTASDGPSVADLEQIGRIQRETEALLPRIEEFRGDRHDRDFLFLDEMLTRLLLKLDNVQVEGRDDVRQARKEAIASITRCINLLESKILGSIDRANSEAAIANPLTAPPPPPPTSNTCDDVSVVEKKKSQQVPEKAESSAAPVVDDTPQKEQQPVTHVSTMMINIGGGGGNV